MVVSEMELMVTDLMTSLDLEDSKDFEAPSLMSQVTVFVSSLPSSSAFELSQHSIA